MISSHITREKYTITFQFSLMWPTEDLLQTEF